MVNTSRCAGAALTYCRKTGCLVVKRDSLPLTFHGLANRQLLCQTREYARGVV